MKKILSFILIMTLGVTMCFMGCNNEKNNEKGTEDDKRYDAEFIAPTYGVVDESGYKTYYFGEDGNDANSGESPQQAKRTVAAANAVIAALTDEYTPVKLLFKKGSKFDDTFLNLSGYSATEALPLIVDSYGSGSEYPEFSGHTAYAVYVAASNTRVRNIGASNKTGKVGIMVKAEIAGALENIVISGCFVHDVNWNWNGEGNSEDKKLSISEVRAICSDADFNYSNGGIIFDTHSSSKIGPSWYQDVWIENNTIQRTARSGMFITTQWARRPGMDWGVNKYCDDDNGYYPSRRVVIKNNYVSHTGGDGIVLLGSKGSFIEGNISYHANYLGRSGYFNAGIWPHSCTDLVIQYNEAAYAHLDNGAGDGEGFDIDIGCSEVYFQYNYSHHNAGGGLLLCNTGTEAFKFHDAEGNVVRTETAIAPWFNVYVRNNVFVDNGSAEHSSAFVISSKMHNLYIENNTVLMPQGIQCQDLVNISDYTGKFGIGEKMYFTNNIFYAPQNAFAEVDVLMCNDYTFSNNLFYNFSESSLMAAEIEGQYMFDPGITRPIDFDGFDAYAHFKATNALVYETGTLLDKMAKYDIAGNNTAGIKYIGAFCK